MTTALGYIRLSDYRYERDASTSPDRQREAVRAYCQAKGWELVDTVEDLDVSGSSAGLRLDRPGLKAVRARFPKVDVLVIPKLDRLARNVADFMAIAEEAERHGVALVSVAESLDLSTPSGRFVAQILAAFGEMEAATIKARIIDGLAKSRELGRFPGGRTPYGYATAPHPSGQGKTLVVEPTEAKVVVELAQRVLDGETIYSLTRDLNARGIPSRTGITWTVQALRGVLTRPSIVGRKQHKGQSLTGPDGLPLQVYAPVLDLETWGLLRARLEVDKPAKERSVVPTPSRLLSRGFVRCGRCGAQMNPATTGGKPAYRCQTASRGRDCSGVSIRAEALESWVVEQVMRLKGHVQSWRTVFHAPAEAVDLADVRAAIEATARAMTADDADVVALSERLVALKAKRKELENAPQEAREEIVWTGETLAEEWEQAETIEAKRELLTSTALLSHVTVAPGRAGRRPFAPERLTIEWANDSTDDGIPLTPEEIERVERESAMLGV